MFDWSSNFIIQYCSFVGFGNFLVWDLIPFFNSNFWISLSHRFRYSLGFFHFPLRLSFSFSTSSILFIPLFFFWVPSSFTVLCSVQEIMYNDWLMDCVWYFSSRSVSEFWFLISSYVDFYLAWVWLQAKLRVWQEFDCFSIEKKHEGPWIKGIILYPSQRLWFEHFLFFIFYLQWYHLNFEVFVIVNFNAFEFCIW